MNDVPTRFSIQEEEYSFPYHYLPHLRDGAFTPFRGLDWGYEYLSYLNYCFDALGEDWTSLLDVGCGDGRFISVAAERVGTRKRMVGIDASAKAIGLAKCLASGGEFIADDVTREGVFASPFDVATCIEVIEHIPPDFAPEFVAGIRRQLRNGGMLIVTVPSTNIAVTAKHYRHFDAKTLVEVLAPHFECAKIQYLSGVSRTVNLAKKILFNRQFVVANPSILNAFYRYYVKNFLVSDENRGGRIFGVFHPR